MKNTMKTIMICRYSHECSLATSSEEGCEEAVKHEHTWACDTTCVPSSTTPSTIPSCITVFEYEVEKQHRRQQQQSKRKIEES